MAWTAHPELRWYRADIEAAAAAADLDPALVAGVVLAESGGLTHAYRYEPGFWKRYKLAEQPAYRDQNPRRWAASYGLLQILGTTARELGHAGSPEALFEPSCGLRWGCAYLRACLEWAQKFEAPDRDTLISALAAYNGGRSSAQKPPSPRNAPYALRVLAHIQHLG